MRHKEWFTRRRFRFNNYKSRNSLPIKTNLYNTDPAPACPVRTISSSLWFHVLWSKIIYTAEHCIFLVRFTGLWNHSMSVGFQKPVSYCIIIKERNSEHDPKTEDKRNPAGSGAQMGYLRRVAWIRKPSTTKPATKIVKKLQLLLVPRNFSRGRAVIPSLAERGEQSCQRGYYQFGM
jgi:hypothetical protein